VNDYDWATHMETTSNLGLPYILPSQAQKHVTHNEALRALDAIVQIAILDRDLAEPPVSPSEGDRYIVAAGGSGAWSGHDDEIAAWQDGAWAFYSPGAGWLAWIADEGALAAWEGEAWTGTGGGLNPAPLVGVNATADATNRLSVKSDAVLLSHDDVTPGNGDQRTKLNKASAANTASILFQDAYSGRAEFGLAGDDDFHIKVSPDGSAWFDAILVDKDTGVVSFPNSAIAGGREILTADRTYYVRTDGDDGNNGLSDNSGGAFATIQKAIDTACALDMSIHNVTIRIADGTYATSQTLKTYLGSGSIFIEGNTSIPQNVVINAPSSAFAGTFYGSYVISGVKISAGVYGLFTGNGNVEYGAIDFGACAIQVFSAGGTIAAVGDYTISGDAGRHLFASGPGSVVRLSNVTISLLATPAFGTAFVHAEEMAEIRPTGITFVGAATGKRFIAERLALLQTNGQSIDWLPGSVAGSISQGGMYT
jgi:hypothetical protein